MPRLDKRVREEIGKLKGTMSQKEAADMFGVNTSSISRIWGKTSLGDINKDVPSPDKFEVEVADLKGRESIEIDLDDGKFLESMNQTLDSFHQEIEMSGNGMSGEKMETIPELDDVDMEPADQPRMPPVMSIPDDVFQSSTFATDMSELKGVTAQQPASDLDMMMGFDDSLLREATDLAKGVEIKQEKVEIKQEKVGSKRKASSESKLPSKKISKVPEVPQVEFKAVPKSPWTKDLLVARINAYVQMHTELLRPYIGSGKKATDDFLVKIAKMDRDKIEETYINLRSLVQFKSQTQVCMVGAIAVTNAVEQITLLSGLKTRGLTEDIMASDEARQTIQECCEDYVMDHPDWFSKVNRPEIRFAQVLFGAAQRRHMQNAMEDDLKVAEDELEGVFESKVVEDGTIEVAC